jgi:hypothetical protein
LIPEVDGEPCRSHIKLMAQGEPKQQAERGSSPASRGGAGVYIEGELGALYLLAMLAGTEAHGLPGARIARIRFQGVDAGFSLDDLVIHGVTPAGDALLEIQSKRTISFSPKDETFKEVAAQIARAASHDVAEERHLLAVATQRTTRKISGAYQDLLEWARVADTSTAFFERLAAKGVASADMREFVSTFRSNLVAAGLDNKDEVIWRYLRRFLILEFDFEAVAPLFRTHAALLAQQVLADEDAGRAEALWGNLIEIVIATGKTGGVLDRQQLREELTAKRGFRLAGDRDYAPARARLAEMAQMTLEGISRTVAGVTLPRLNAVTALDEAADVSRFVEIRGNAGVGKSGVLRQQAERAAAKAPIIVLDPVSTPPGGWLGFAHALGIPGTAKEFLTDLAVSGGAVIFIDSLHMFADPERRLTVSQLLRAASKIAGFAVVTTGRTVLTGEGEPWLDAEIIEAFGGLHLVEVEELSDAEVEILVDRAPELRALLDSGHPAAPLARNLYRLSRLLKLPSDTVVRTEAALARFWWESGDISPKAEIRAVQRILANLGERTLGGESGVVLQTDSAARAHLLGSLSLKEVRRDRLDFYHDVLRDWAVGTLIAEDPTRLASLDLSVPVSPHIARGIEFAGRLALETAADGGAWLDLLARLSPEGAHGSWRRHALLAIVRSEAGSELMEKCSAALLARGAALFSEICTTILAVETISFAELVRVATGEADPSMPGSLRTDRSGTSIWALRWALRHGTELPVQAIPAVLDLVEIQVPMLRSAPQLARRTGAMLFFWLRQLDVRDAECVIPVDGTAERLSGDARRHMMDRLRTLALVTSDFASEQAKAYLTELAAEGDSYKVKAIRPYSQMLAKVAPAELSALIVASLVERGTRHSDYRSSRGKPFGFADSDYMPPSPAQPPFLDLLVASPTDGLGLIRTLVAEAASHWMEDDEGEVDGLTLVFDEGPRFFPAVGTYLWSRDQAHEYSVASGLKALEAWSQKRLDDGEPVDAVLADILGPEGSCAAYLLVAIDVLLSHFDKGREALVPFLACPELLALDKTRAAHDQIGHDWLLVGEKEPAGPITLADLKARPSRGTPLSNALIAYLRGDAAGNTLRERLALAVAELEPYAACSDIADARFAGRYALNYLDLSNWVEIEGGKLMYQSPSDEAAHLAQMQARGNQSAQASEKESRISLAIDGGEYATAEAARIAVEYAAGDLPDASDTDVLKSRSTRLTATALLVARDGDAALLKEHEAWVRKVIDLALAEESNRYTSSSDNLRYNRPALATLALIHLWLRKRCTADRYALIAIATRSDRCVHSAFGAALPAILEVEPRLFKSTVRAAFASCRWRWHSHHEADAEQRHFEVELAATVEAAVAAEIAWLDGGPEPAWPDFPKEKPSLRRAIRMRVPDKNVASPPEAAGSNKSPEPVSDVAAAVAAWVDKRPEAEEPDGQNKVLPGFEDASEPDAIEASSIIHVDSQLAAKWLALLNGAPAGSIGWASEIVDAYSDWSARINGMGHPAEAEIDRSPDEWNQQYYVLYARMLIEAPADRFDQAVRLITYLPDEPFGDVAEIVIYAADVLYFNDPQRDAARPVEVRERMVARVLELSRWRPEHSPGSLRIDHHTGGVAGKVLFNNHGLIGGTRSYLVPAIFDRVDPLLNTIRPLLPGGPTAFVGLCIMNMLMVAPRARHLDFLLDATEAWQQRLPGHAGFWNALGIGRRIAEWFDAATIEAPDLLGPAHPMRARIDHLLGQLVGVGVAEAHELEKKIEVAAREFGSGA